uniref:DNA polymerase II subunit 2 n=1 Tax=Panagrolaimus sp. PS1159 TaxID=55785 RepID=A0AC35FS39_9BILA
MDQADLRRKVKRRFDLRNITLGGDALTHIAQNVKNKNDQEIDAYVGKIVDIFEKEQIEDQVITQEMLVNCLRKAFGKDVEKDKRFMLINANEWKKEIYDPLTKMYKEKENFDEQAENARYDLIRDHVTNPSILRIELLYSRSNEAVNVLGMLRRHKGNIYAIEDPTGYVKLSFNDVIFDDGLFFEGGIYEFSGVYKNHTLIVDKIKLPQLKSEPLVAKQRNPWSTRDSIIILSDVWLDDSNVLLKIDTILDGMTDVYAVILCGEFLSPNVQDSIQQALSNGFRHLNNIIQRFEDKFNETRFIIVPSFDDFPNMQVSPRPPIPPTAVQELKNFYFASNPCKLQCRDQTIVIYRDNIIQKACRNAVKVSSDVTNIHTRFCETILSQKHYSPLPLYVSPVIPKMDHIFNLTPTPDLLILADNYTQYHFKEDSRKNVFVNPGSFVKSGFDFALYYPASRNVDLCKC